MMVHPSRNGLAAEQFIREVLNYCDGKPTFIVDNAHGLGRRWRSLAYHIMLNPFGDRSLIESVYSPFEQRTKIFFNNITLNPINRSDRF
jgi:transposase-like protein